MLAVGWPGEARAYPRFVRCRMARFGKNRLPRTDRPTAKKRNLTGYKRFFPNRSPLRPIPGGRHTLRPAGFIHANPRPT